MLKIKDNVDLKELEKYGLRPIYRIKNETTGETEIIEYRSDSYHYSFKYLRFPIKKKSFWKRLIIKAFRRRIEDEVENDNRLEEKSLIDADLLYDLIKAGLVEKVK